MLRSLALFALAAPLLAAAPADAREYFVGGPVKEQDMEIVANYLLGIEMAPMPMTMGGGMMEHGNDMIHLRRISTPPPTTPMAMPTGRGFPILPSAMS
jgi:hypothetical protein